MNGLESAFGIYFPHALFGLRILKRGAIIATILA